ncbi:hypothetical protein [Pseudomonas sp.]|uniref:hypothetical protein n=1 Tax=Pseudomonas sp. TaxID=306 RepID=UPI0025910DAB|nr:hypothetical protein [Pseudomonas sp.]
MDIITAALAHDHDKLIEVGVSRYEAFEEGHCKRGAKCWRCRWLGKRRMSPLICAPWQKSIALNATSISRNASQIVDKYDFIEGPSWRSKIC